MKEGQEHIHKQKSSSISPLEVSALISHSLCCADKVQPQPAKQLHAEWQEVVSFVCCTASLPYTVIKMLITKQFKYMTDNAVKAYS